MIQCNMIDVVTTNGCPEVTPAQLLAEEPSEEDCRKLEQVMGRFSSTTAFLNALKQVLFGLEGFAECDLLDKFIPIMAQVEAAAMNGDPATIRIEGSNKELILVEHNPSPPPVNCSDGIGGDGMQS